METPKVTAHTTMLQPKRGGSFYSSNANRRNGTPGALRFATLAAGNSSTTPCGANDEGTGVTQAQTVRSSAFGPIVYDGRSYGVKAHEFRRIADVPRRAGLPREVALDIHPADAADAELLRDGGWRLADPARVAEPRAFARYVAASGGELSAAQGVYVGPSGDRA